MAEAGLTSSLTPRVDRVLRPGPSDHSVTLAQQVDWGATWPSAGQLEQEHHPLACWRRLGHWNFFPLVYQIWGWKAEVTWIHHVENMQQSMKPQAGRGKVPQVSLSISPVLIMWAKWSNPKLFNCMNQYISFFGLSYRREFLPCNQSICRLLWRHSG